MKKLLLSCAVVALAMPAFAGSVKDILGTYTAEYGWMVAGEEKEGVVDDVTITQVSGNDVEISSNLFASFVPNFKAIPATYNEEDNTLVIDVLGIDAGDGRRFGIVLWHEDQTYEWLEELTMIINSDGTITTENDEDVNWYVRDPSDSWWDYIMWSLVLYPVEVGGGDEPGDEPGAEPEAVDAICGVWQSNYDFWWDSTPHPQVSEDVTITKVNGNEVEISPNLIQFANGTNVFNAPIPAFYDPETNTLTIYSADLESDYDVYFEFANESVPECTFLMDSDGWFSFDDGDNDYDICIDDLGTGWLDYAVYELYLEPIEVGAAGVKNVEVNDADAPVVYYDLQGRKINNPSNGLFIRKQGSKATKVIIK